MSKESEINADCRMKIFTLFVTFRLNLSLEVGIDGGASLNGCKRCCLTLTQRTTGDWTGVEAVRGQRRGSRRIEEEEEEKKKEGWEIVWLLPELSE